QLPYTCRHQPVQAVRTSSQFRSEGRAILPQLRTKLRTQSRRLNQLLVCCGGIRSPRDTHARQSGIALRMTPRGVDVRKLFAWPDIDEFGVAARMPSREQTEGLGVKKRPGKTLPAQAGNICL